MKSQPRPILTSDPGRPGRREAVHRHLGTLPHVAERHRLNPRTEATLPL